MTTALPKRLWLLKVRRVQGDFNAQHTGEEFGKTKPFRSDIARDILALAIATGQANQLGVFEGTTNAPMLQIVKQTGTLGSGGTIQRQFEIAEKKEISKIDRGVATLDTVILNQQSMPVMDGQGILMT